MLGVAPDPPRSLRPAGAPSDPHPRGLFLFPAKSCGVSRGMAKRSTKKEERTWWWIEGLMFDSFGVARWFPLYNEREERRVKAVLRACQAGDQAVGDRQVKEWRAVSPEEYPKVHSQKAWRKVIKRAATGECPNCGAGPKHSKQGRSKGYAAFRCGKCKHTWRIAGTRDPNYVEPAPTVLLTRPEMDGEPAQKPSKAPKSESGSSGAKTKGKKSKKGKGKKAKKG